jgi:hypothetical protein
LGRLKFLKYKKSQATLKKKGLKEFSMQAKNLMQVAKDLKKCFHYA